MIAFLLDTADRFPSSILLLFILYDRPRRIGWTDGRDGGATHFFIVREPGLFEYANKQELGGQAEAEHLSETGRTDGRKPFKGPSRERRARDG